MCFSFYLLQKIWFVCCASLYSERPTKRYTPIDFRLFTVRRQKNSFVAPRVARDNLQKSLKIAHISVGRCLPRQLHIGLRQQKTPVVQYAQRGFTLIEIIIGIVALSISLAIVSSFIAPAEQQSADQIQQIKAAELGQGMLDEILGRAFDENSDMVGSHWRCGETVPVVRQNCSSTLGTEGESDRSQYDDVDDYNGFNLKVNSTNNNLDSSFSGFTIGVVVAYAGSELGLSNNNLAKRITVTVTTPLGTAINFTGYKANF
jgi:MSHA pilin protein MshD